MLRGWLTLVMLMVGAGCGGGRPPAREPAAASSKSPSAALPRPSRWLLHAFSPNVVEANSGVVIAYTASYVGPERVEKSLVLPPAITAAWSPDGHWLALCSRVPAGGAEQELHQALAIRFDGDRASAPLQLGDCASFDWAPAGQLLLIRNGAAWRIVDFSSAVPHQSPIAEELAPPVAWSPNGRRILAHAVNGKRKLRVVHALEPTPRVEPLDFNGWVTLWCRWSPQDALACAVQTLGAAPESALEILYAGAGMASSVPLEGRLDSFDWTTEQNLVYELEGPGGIYAHHSGTSTQLFLPGNHYRFSHERSSLKAAWLLDTASGNARLWNLGSTPHSTILRGIPGPLVNPHWSPNGKHALVGIVHPLYSAYQCDVWLVANATTHAAPARIASAPPGKASSSLFSPASEWALVTMMPDVIPLAGASAPTNPETTLQHSAVHVATRTTVPQPFGGGEWASDDSAFVTVDHEGGRVLLFRVQGNTFRPPEVLHAATPGPLRVLWQPVPG